MAEIYYKLKRTFIFGLVGSILILMTIIPGCIIDDSDDDKKKKTSESPNLPLTVVDDMGNSITIYEYPEKIVSLSASITEILYSLDVGDKIVGVDSGSNYPEEAKAHDVVFTWTTDPKDSLNDETFVSLDPDIIIMDHHMDTSEVTRNKIWNYGYDIVIVNPEVVEDVLDNIELIGKVTNRTDKARTLVDSLKERIDTVEEKTNDHESDEIISVLYVVYYDPDYGWPCVGGTKTYLDDIVDKAGGMNVVSDPDYPFIDPEEIILMDPDIIVCSYDVDFSSSPKENIINDDVLKNLDAVKNGKVYNINTNLVDRPGPRIVDGLEEFQKLILES